MKKADRIQWRIAIFVLVAFIGTMLAGTFVFLKFQDVIAQQEIIASRYATRLAHAEAMRASFEEKVAQSRAYFITGNDAITREISLSRERFQRDLTLLESTSNSTNELEDLRAIRDLERKHDEILWLLLRAQSFTRQFAERFETQLRPVRLDVKAKIDKFVIAHEKEFVEMQARTSAHASSSKSQIYSIAGLASILGICLAFLLLRTTRALGRTGSELQSALRMQNISQARFVDLVNHLDHSVVWEADTEPFKLNFVSERLHYLLGVPPKEFLEDSQLFFNYTHPDDRQNLRSMLDEARRTQTDERVEHRMRTVDGKEIWVHTGVHVRSNPEGVDQFYGLTVDITPTKKKEEALERSEAALLASTERLRRISDDARESEKRIRSFLDSMPAMGFIADANGDVTYYNKSWLEYTGLPNAEFAKWHPVVHPDHLSKVVERWDHSVRTGEPYVIETLIRRHDGVYRWVLGRATPIRDENGKIVEWYGTNQDVHDYRSAEEKLKETAAYLEDFKHALDASSIVALTDARGVITYVNDKFCEISKYSREELIGKTHKIVNSGYHSKEFFADFWRTISSGRIWQGDIKNRAKDGSHYWVQTFIVPFLAADGKPYQYLAIRTDITKRKLNEIELESTKTKLELAMTVSEIGPWEYDVAKNELIWSETIRKICEVESGTKITPEYSARLTHPDDVQHVLDMWTKAVRDSSSFESTFRVVTPTGRTKWVISRGKSILDSSGKAVRLVGTLTDVTQMKNASEERQRLIESLEAERETREKFVNLITHDLRTPLSAAKMAAQILARKKDDPEAFTLLVGKIIENSNRMDDMIRDLLDTNRIRAGKKLTVSVGPCDLKDVISKTIDDLTMIHGKRFVLKASAETRGQWDCSGMRRVTENLLNNAIKYGYPNSPVTVNLTTQAGVVELSVHNEGDSLSEADQRKLFDQFSRTESAERSGKSGWGIGLTIVQGIAEAHGGKVGVSSGSDGTTFKVWLPVDSSTFVTAENAAPPSTSH